MAPPPLIVVTGRLDRQPPKPPIRNSGSLAQRLILLERFFKNCLSRGNTGFRAGNYSLLGPFFDGPAIARNWSHEQAVLPTTRRAGARSRVPPAITKLKTSARNATSWCAAGGKPILRQPTNLAAFDPIIMRLSGGSQTDARYEPSVPAISPFMAIAHHPVRSANRGGHGVSRQWQYGRAAHRR